MFANLTDKEYLDLNGAKFGEMGEFDGKLLMRYLQNCARDFPKKFKWIADENGEWDEARKLKFKEITHEVVFDLLEDNCVKFATWEYRWMAEKLAKAGTLESVKEYLPLFVYREAKKVKPNEL